MRIGWICLILGLASFSSTASSQSLALDGESYTNAFAHLQGYDRLIEHTRPGETVRTWRKLLTVHWFPDDTAKPEQATNRLAAFSDRFNRRVEAILSENAATYEAIVSFTVAKSDGRVTELNIFKYAPAYEGRGLVAIQYAARYANTPSDLSRMKRDQARIFEALKTFDMSIVNLRFQPAT